MWSILITKAAEKELNKAPLEIRDAFDAWSNLVEKNGPQQLKKINGYWDHALRGDWKGARASSLNQQWRVIYTVDGHAVSILILRVTPHDYRRK